MIATLGAERARGRLRRGRPVPIDDPQATPLPLTRVTVVAPEAFADPGEAVRWLERTSADTERAAELVDAALRTLNRLLHAHLAATQDPYVPEISMRAAAMLRLGIGTGDQLADGRWIEARELPPSQSRTGRTQVGDIRPQERIAAVLAGRERVDACETLLLRARADFEQGRQRAGVLQLAAALEALLAELGGEDDPDQRRDLTALRAQQGGVRSAAESVLADEPSQDALEELSGTLRLGERILRRRRLLR